MTARIDTLEDGDGIVYPVIHVDQIYPVGSIYMSVSSTNPGTIFGGTWVAWGAGRVPVGVDTTQTEFDTVEETGGSMNHAHTAGGLQADVANNSGKVVMRRQNTLAFTATSYITGVGEGDQTNVAEGTNVSGNTAEQSTLQPYITCYMWKRTA